MKQSLSRRYFLICIACVLVCIVILGVSFLVFSTNFFRQDKYSMMERNAKIAANITASDYIDNNYSGINNTTISTTFGVLSNTISAEFILVDVSGLVIYSSDVSQTETTDDVIIPDKMLNDAFEGGYQATKHIEGVTDSVSYIVGMPVEVDGEIIAAVFVYSSAGDLMAFFKQLSEQFVFLSIIVLLISFILIYLVTSKMTQPLKQMVEATHSFSEGDFSKRIPVQTKDEVGRLSMAFNNMASTLAVNEDTRRSFIANVSHELKTPMTTIGGFVDGILDGTIPPEKQNEYLTIVSSEVQRLKRLVHSMLDTARMDAGEMKLELINFDISELVRLSTFTFERTIEEKNVNILGLDQDKVMVCADRDLIHQVVYNLMENAVKFVNENGEISVSYEKKDNKVYTRIKNTGQGLSKDDASKIFARFYKSDRSRTGHQSGVGLGLHIVKSIVNYHEGEITAESVEGEFTEFVFSVKMATEPGAKTL